MLGNDPALRLESQKTDAFIGFHALAISYATIWAVYFHGGTSSLDLSATCARVSVAPRAAKEHKGTFTTFSKILKFVRSKNIQITKLTWTAPNRTHQPKARAFRSSIASHSKTECCRLGLPSPFSHALP
ncbi:hypothetical protein VKT23_013138 [Stygiomarasmius scandens]|uniref:Uncharacterized protein n=1 Tax=Marasmiellus scandens TaxID=2682957 RepID=A0ABR1J4Y2_9AGAR